MKGKVYLVGAGPGAPDLLTLRAVRVLERAGIVFHDALVHAQTLAIAAGAEMVAVGKRSGRHSTAQQFINKRLVDAAGKYRVVVRLKGGDPMLFGRAQEEIEALVAAGVEYEVIPGITAALAASADLGISLTRRGVSRSVAWVTHRHGQGEQEGRWLGAALAADTVGIYMGAGEAGRISDELIRAGKPAETPVAIVENASSADVAVFAGTLAKLPSLAAAGRGGPALILVGEVYRQIASREHTENERICA